MDVRTIIQNQEEYVYIPELTIDPFLKHTYDIQAIKHNKYKLLLALFFSAISTPATLIAIIVATGYDSLLNSPTFGYITVVIIFAILFFVYFELIYAYNHLLKMNQKSVFW